MPRRILNGIVVSDKAHKTVIVRVERRVMHPVYKKFVRRSKKYAAHDEDNRFKIGDARALRDPDSRPVSRGSWHEAIAYCAWLNDELLGEHEGYAEPFEFEVGHLLARDRPNVLVVKVSSPWDTEVAPGLVQHLGVLPAEGGHH